MTCWNSEGELAEGMTGCRTLTTYQKPNPKITKLVKCNESIKRSVVALIGVLEYCPKVPENKVVFS